MTLVVSLEQPCRFIGGRSVSGFHLDHLSRESGPRSDAYNVSVCLILWDNCLLSNLRAMTSVRRPSRLTLGQRVCLQILFQRHYHMSIHESPELIAVCVGLWRGKPAVDAFLNSALVVLAFRFEPAEQ